MSCTFILRPEHKHCGALQIVRKNALQQEELQQLKAQLAAAAAGSQEAASREHSGSGLPPGAASADTRAISGRPSKALATDDGWGWDTEDQEEGALVSPSMGAESAANGAAEGFSMAQKSRAMSNAALTHASSVSDAGESKVL